MKLSAFAAQTLTEADIISIDDLVLNRETTLRIFPTICIDPLITYSCEDDFQ